LAAAGLAEIRDWRKFRVQRPACVPTVIEVVDSGLRFGFPLEASIHVSYQVISHVIANMKFQKMAELGQFAVQVFIYLIEVVLKLLVVHFAIWVVSRVVIDIGEEDGL